MTEQKREWKPGDVAMVRGEVAFVTTSAGGVEYVETASGMGWSEMPADARPLVVIDAEDEAAMDRLGDLLEEHGWQPKNRAGVFDSAADLAAALREFANPKPPKPEEPTGLGAVVEDSGGWRWVRVDGLYPWVRSLRDEGAYARRGRWDHIDAVKVLSEGVVPS